jgi:hypothetical protein
MIITNNKICCSFLQKIHYRMNDVILLHSVFSRMGQLEHYPHIHIYVLVDNNIWCNIFTDFYCSNPILKYRIDNIC